MDDLPAAEETTPVVPDESLDALPAPEEETNALTAFTTQWEQSLAAKAEEERKLDGEVRAEAVKELDEWKKQREIRLTKKKEMNRSTEAVFVEQIEAALTSNNTWERVTKLVDITQDDSKDGLKSDVGRMRSLFLQLKNEPIAAK